MKNINLKTQEPVEVMALFSYEMTPCQPLSFKLKGQREVEITELVHTQIQFIGNTTKHIFDVLAGQKSYQLEFNSLNLSWHLTPANS